LNHLTLPSAIMLSPFFVAPPWEADVDSGDVNKGVNSGPSRPG
jgi:hypothetical protein